MQFGKLTKVDLRGAWKHEAHDFTVWLAMEENLSMLGEELGIEIELIQTEAEVGAFSADILATEGLNGGKIIIENQLERTDHDHLGKIITYAAGIDAEYIIWIVREERAEHVQAIDWLNEHTDKKLHFFLLRMELWQIGTSAPAPKFHIVSQPNNWTRTIRNSVAEAELSETKILQLKFWDEFKNFCVENGALFRLRSPSAQHWYDISIGVSFAHVSLTINSQRQELGCELYIPDSKALYFFLATEKEAIESQIQEKLEWMELPDRKAARIKFVSAGDIFEEDNWPKYFSWLMHNAGRFVEIFGAQSIRFKEGI